MKTIGDLLNVLVVENIPCDYKPDERKVVIEQPEDIGDLVITESGIVNRFDIFRETNPIFKGVVLDDVVKIINHCRIHNTIEFNTDTQVKISEILDGMKDLLLYKNQKYGDSAINPKKIFYKGDSTNSILIRLDDKLGRIMNNPEDKPRTNDVADIIGYCTLLLISMGVTPEDIAKFKD